MLLRRVFKNKIQALFIVAAVFILLNVSISSLFLNSANEIIYNYERTIFVCLKDSAVCAYSAELKVANTGTNVLDSIIIENKNIPEVLTSSVRTLDLNASSPRKGEPNIGHNSDLITIDNLHSGTLLRIEYSGSVSIEQREVLEVFHPEISANAKLINADPEGTEIVRFLSIFF